VRYPRFIVQLGGVPLLTRLNDVLQAIELEGFDGVSFPDHLEEDSAPIASVALAAAAPTSLSVSALVMNNDLRHPAIIAAEFATIAAAHPGRIGLGIGAGWQASDFDHLGARFDAPGVRVDRLREALTIIADLRSHGAVTHQGRAYQLSGFRLPGGPASFSLIVGGGGPRVLTLAGRYADVVSVNPSLARPDSRRAVANELTWESYAKKLNVARSAAELANRTPTYQVRTAFIHVGSDAASIERDLCRAYDVEPQVARRMPAVLIGNARDVAEKILETSERLGIDEWVLHDQDRPRFAEVLAHLPRRER